MADTDLIPKLQLQSFVKRIIKDLNKMAENWKNVSILGFRFFSEKCTKFSKIVIKA